VFWLHSLCELRSCAECNAGPAARNGFDAATDIDDGNAIANDQADMLIADVDNLSVAVVESFAGHYATTSSSASSSSKQRTSSPTHRHDVPMPDSDDVPPAAQDYDAVSAADPTGTDVASRSHTHTIGPVFIGMY
jgi:hypothetical protein